MNSILKIHTKVYYQYLFYNLWKMQPSYMIKVCLLLFLLNTSIDSISSLHTKQLKMNLSRAISGESPQLQRYHAVQTAETGQSSDALSGGQIAGIVLGCLTAVVVIGLVIYLVKRNSNADNVESQTSIKSSAENLPMGLPNLGNTCFLNTVIQNLYSCKYLVQYIIANQEKGIIIGLLARLFKAMQQRSHPKVKTSLQNLLAQLKKRHQDEGYGMNQNDVLHFGLNFISLLKQESRDIGQYFAIQYYSKCGCKDEINEKTTLQTYLPLTQKCTKCRQEHRIKIESAPRYLIIFNSEKILNSETKSFQSSSESSRFLYKLISYASYNGNGRGGHYKANRIIDGKWFQFSDSYTQQMSKCNFAEMHMAFFQKQ